MALEASIVERLQELRRWQAEQQERLLKHQQEQRETLNREQIRMYQALGLSVQNNNEEEHGPNSIFKDTLEENNGVDTPVKTYEDISKTTIENVDCISHIPSQRQHELLHNFSPNLATVEQNTYDDENALQHLSLSLSQQLVSSEEKSSETTTTEEPPMNFEKECSDGSGDNSPNNSSTPCKSNDFHNGQNDNRVDNFNLQLQKLRGSIPESFVGDIEPLPLDEPIKKKLIIDDIPIPSPRKDFNTLLEERLRDSQFVTENEKLTNGNNCKKSIKKPFLKKGQGLARFRLGSVAENTNKQLRPRTMSLPSTVRLGSGKNCKSNLDECNRKPRTIKNGISQTDKAQKKHLPVPNRMQSKLNLKNVKPPARVRSKSMCTPREFLSPPSNQLKENDSFNISDIESKTKRELEEVRIFELLEEKAENSSFCSTSSTVVALLQQSVQSTPLKIKDIKKNKVSTLTQNWPSGDNNRNEDLLLAEIVYTTQSNSITHNSSKIYTKNNQNDFGNSQNNKDVEPDENVPHKFEDDHFSDENLIENTCELPYGTDIDPNYGTDCPKTDEANCRNYKDFNNPIKYEKNTSLHVRFSEYNEYKTIGLTDTSTISTESEAQRSYSDQRAWSDCSVATDSSDTEDYTSIVEFNQMKSLENRRFMKNKSKTLSKVVNERSMNRYDNNDLHNELSSDLHKDHYYEENQSDFEVESEGKNYSYNGEGVDNNVLESTSEENDENFGVENETSTIADSTLVEQELRPVKTQENGLIFKSELLKVRLLELEREIEIFRKENVAVTTLKEKLQEERRTMERHFKERESRLDERKKRLESTIQDEKKKLVREKAALENRLKDAQVKAQQSKQERQEVQSLKDQLEELRKEMNEKESRWSAAQARHRSQVRILQTENSKLKQDIQKLQTTRKANMKTGLHAKHGTLSNTKAIHQINKQLAVETQLTRKQDSSSDESEVLIEPMMEAMHLNKDIDDQEIYNTINSDGSKIIIYDENQTGSKNKNCTLRKRDLYENLLKDATIGLKESEEATRKAVQSLENKKNLSKCSEQITKSLGKVNDTKVFTDTNRTTEESCLDGRKSFSSCESEVLIEKPIDFNSKLSDNPSEYCKSQENSSENRTATNTPESRKSSNSKTNCTVDKQGLREVHHSDGRIEVWYPNGNVKKTSADGTITKLIYYNGDVCESRKDGTVKYYYATTRTWHTTMPDALEILEFSDGQIERRSKDGTVEVSFPDGSVRILQANGTEKWALPDGTIVETSADGEKLLILPNGQREVHTKEHKRREYPDGTVKLVYPDGSQETRYATGRVRLKDKDGNLLMDSHHH